MTNLSQWFDLAEQKPWEVGVYEVEDSWGCIWRCRWDSEKFLAQAKSVGVANLQTHPATIFIVKWRGLSTNPEVKKKASGNRKVTRHIVYMKIDGCALMSKIFGIYESLAEAKKKQAMHRRSSLKTIRFRTPE